MLKCPSPNGLDRALLAVVGTMGDSSQEWGEERIAVVSIPDLILFKIQAR